nr:metal ABC transporter substrate-binding protein [Propionicimonas sp.]
MRIWKRLATAGATLSLLALSACAAYTDAPATPVPGASGDDRLKVSVAFYPFQFVAERVGGDLVSVTNLTAPGAEPHDLELTPQQVASLTTDDLVIYQSGFQPAVDTAVEQSRPKRTVDTASFLTLMKVDHTDEDADHADEADDHDHGAYDPHTWLDPTNLVAVAEHVRDALAAARPDATQQFADNTSRLVADLTELDTTLKADLDSCAITPFITSHAAFGYFAHRYGLTQVGINGVEPDVEPSAARIAEVQRIAKENKVTTIFFETLVSPAVAQSIAGDLGLQTDVLDPLEGITADSRGSDYLEVMRANGTALQKSNQCA